VTSRTQLVVAWYTLALVFAVPGDAKSADKVEGVELSGWVEIRGASFSLVTDLPTPAAMREARNLLDFIEVLRVTSNAERFEPRLPLRIVLFRNFLDYRKFSSIGASAGEMHEGTLRWHLLVNRQAATGSEVLFHEYAHYLIHNQGVLYPRWFDEGFAELVSTVQFHDGKAILGAPPAGALLTLKRPGELPLRNLLGAREYPRQIGLFYAQAWLLTHYLHTAHAYEEPSLLEPMQRYLARLQQGDAWARAFDAAFELPVSQLERRLEQHRARVIATEARFPAISVALEADGSESLRRVSLEPAQAAAILGEVQLTTRGDVRSAAKFFRKSLALGGGTESAQIGLAQVYAKQGRLGSARKLAEQAAVSKSAEALYTLAWVRELVARDADEEDPTKMERARQSFRELIAKYPELPAGYNGLGRTFVDGKTDSVEGIQAFETLRETAPALVDGFALAKLYAAANRRRDAREALWRLRRWHGTRGRERAQKLLDEMERRDLADLFGEDATSGPGEPPEGVPPK